MVRISYVLVILFVSESVKCFKYFYLAFKAVNFLNFFFEEQMYFKNVEVAGCICNYSDFHDVHNRVALKDKHLQSFLVE